MGRATNVKPPPASFLGREEELAMLGEILSVDPPGDRLVTLRGTAGAGKTRLAMRFAELHAATWPDGIWFVDLMAARDLDAVCAAVARAFDVPMRHGSDVEQLGHALADRRVLVILDNCEQCVPHVASAVQHWLDLAPNARFIATSREALRISGERVVEVGPLPLPEGERLFVDRARRVRAGWTAAGEAESARVVEIVRHLDGLPLAIELAAARMDMMGTADIVQRLSKRFDLLSSPVRGTNERQRTLRGAIAWSWDLSSEWERAALVQCAIFRGSFSIDAAEHVIDLSAYPDAPPALEAVRALRDKSYLTSAEPPELPGELWLAMYESVRELALENLPEQQAGAIARHGQWYAKTASELGESVWGRDRSAIRRLGAMRDNLAAAHEAALERNEPEIAARIAIALERIALDRGPHTAYAVFYDRTIAAADGRVADALLARLLVARSFLRMLRVDRPGARADAERAASISRVTGDRVLEVRALQVIGQVAVPERDDETTRATAERLSEIASSTDDVHLEALARMVLGLLFVVRGHRLDDARVELERSLACFHRVGDLHRIATVLNVFGVLLAELGRLDEARDVLQEAIDVCRDTNDRFREASCLAYLAGVCMETDRLEEARSLAEASVRAFATVGERWQQALARGMLGAALAMAGDVDGAERALDRAEAELATFGDEVYVTAIRVHRGLVDLARGRRAEAEARLVVDKTRSDDVRFATRMLRRALERTPGEVPPDALVVADDGRWFRPPRSNRVDLSSRPTLAQLLRALAEQRLAQPGRSLSIDALLERGWPGERILHEAATNRVRVAMTTLRRLGLADVLKTAPDGYALDRAVPVVIAYM